MTARRGADVAISRIGAEAAAEVLRLTHAAFAPYAHLEPPSGAVSETLADVEASLAPDLGVMAYLDRDAVAAARLRPDGDALWVRRVAVEPALQGRGIGTQLMRWIEADAAARNVSELRVGVRRVLPGNLEFYTRLGYAIAAEHAHAGYTETTWFEMVKSPLAGCDRT